MFSLRITLEGNNSDNFKTADIQMCSFAKSFITRLVEKAWLYFIVFRNRRNSSLELWMKVYMRYIFNFTYIFSFLKLSLACCSVILVHALGIFGLPAFIPYLFVQYSISSFSNLLNRKPQNGVESQTSSGRIFHVGMKFLNSWYLCHSEHR